MKFNPCFVLLWLILLVSLGIADELEQDEFEEDLLDLYGDEVTISIATGTEQPISQAPAVASVITAREIAAMGAHDLDEVLATVPGLHVSRSTLGYNPIYTFRGVYTATNPQVLMLVNGISINNLFVGDRSQVWGGFPVESISRIEVIRGPGSALYGADAFAGVINIVTKNGQEINGTEAGARIGSFDTQEAWLLHGSEFNGLDFAFMLEAKSTNGHREKIDSDLQSLSDQMLSTSASLAPAATTNGRDNLDIRLEIGQQYWQFRAGLQRRRNAEIGFGVGSALDTHAEYESDRWNADLTYHDPEFAQDWDMQAQLSFLNTSAEVSEDVFVLPPGAVFMDQVFPDGVIGNAEVWERHWRVSLTALYSGVDRHTVRLGGGYNHTAIYKVKESNNFTGQLADISDTASVFLPEDERKNQFIFVQDIWNFARDWTLTAGIRYDDYNDFGDTWNPRAALVWSASYDTTIKFLYGQAFRAPSFAEFRNQNNPVALGNDELKPEQMETFELALASRKFSDMRLGLNIFHYEWNNIIDFISIGSGSLQAHNQGKQTGYGAELEIDWKLTDELELHANYAFQDSEDQATGEDAGNAPHHQIHASIDWQVLPQWSLRPAVSFIMDRDRPPADNRDELDDYMLMDLTLSSRSYSDQWEFKLGVKNLFDVKPEEPTDASFNISNDLPLAGRYVFTEINFRAR